MTTTLKSFKESLGDFLDAAFIGLDFTVPRSEWTDIGEIQGIGLLPRAIYTFSVVPARELVFDVVAVKDLVNLTQTSTERIPHKMSIAIRVVSDVQWEADEMRDALMTHFGNAPCVDGMPLYYEGFSDAAKEFDTGIYQYSFEYTAYLFLDGRSETTSLITHIDDNVMIAGEIVAPEEATPPPLPEGSVDINEAIFDTITRP